MLGHNASLSTASIFAISVLEYTCVVNFVTFQNSPFISNFFTILS